MPLWVDAICINQSNIPERTSQVRMMREIYSKADCVVVWLGEAEATDGMALQFLKEIYAPWVGATEQQRLMPGQGVLTHDVYLYQRVPQASFEALAAFLLRPWFSRIWIVQEFLLARQVTIWCGASTLNEEFPILEAIVLWSKMPNCVHRTNNIPERMAKKDKKAKWVGKMKVLCASTLWQMKWVRGIGVGGILYFMGMTRVFGATDPRDHTFALIGLTSDIDESLVDYSKSYRDIAKELSCMLLHGTREPTLDCVLDLWSFITREEEQEFTDPSWVVDLAWWKDSIYMPMTTAYPSVKTVMERTEEIQFLERDGEESILVRGSVFDVITHVIPFPYIFHGPESDLEFVQNLLAIAKWFQRVGNIIAPTGHLTTQPVGARSYPVYEPTGEFLYDAFWRTLCCNRSTVNALEPSADHDGYVAWLNYWRISLLRHETRNRKWTLLGLATVLCSALTYRFRRNKFSFCAIPLASLLLAYSCNWIWNWFWDVYLHLLQVKYKNFESLHAAWTNGRQFGVTSKGRIGMLPIAARVGDSVGLFAGCRVPYVLRKFEERYRIVGDAVRFQANQVEQGWQVDGNIQDFNQENINIDVGANAASTTAPASPAPMATAAPVDVVECEGICLLVVAVGVVLDVVSAWMRTTRPIQRVAIFLDNSVNADPLQSFSRLSRTRVLR
ncbi:hypothetical protein SVAN01_10133 [Stagonosporopsis vannaccii]|nr:hypothetical protein SVAN01_10133 [Stagonosporopsis vannaccii]